MRLWLILQGRYDFPGQCRCHKKLWCTTWSISLFDLPVAVEFIFINSCYTHSPDFSLRLLIAILSSMTENPDKPFLITISSWGIRSMISSFPIKKQYVSEVRVVCISTRSNVGWQLFQLCLHIPARPQILQQPPMSASARPIDRDNCRHLHRFPSIW
jgi:hypothetical protein